MSLSKYRHRIRFSFFAPSILIIKMGQLNLTVHRHFSHNKSNYEKKYRHICNGHIQVRSGVDEYELNEDERFHQRV